MEIVNNKWKINELRPNLLLIKWRYMKLIHIQHFEFMFINNLY